MRSILFTVGTSMNSVPSIDIGTRYLTDPGDIRRTVVTLMAQMP